MYKANWYGPHHNGKPTPCYLIQVSVEGRELWKEHACIAVLEDTGIEFTLKIVPLREVKLIRRLTSVMEEGE